MVTTEGWSILPSEEYIMMGGVYGSTLFFRAEVSATAFFTEDEWKTEVLCGHGVGESEITIRGKARPLRIVSNGRVWIKDTKRDQTKVIIDPDVFTTLDRPPLLSPEMLAVQQMLKRNEIERERERSAMMELIHANERKSNPVLQVDTSKKAKPADAKDGGASGAESGKPKGDKDKGILEPDGEKLGTKTDSKASKAD